MSTSRDSNPNHVRGPSAFNRPASVAVESAAFIADLGISLLLFAIILRVFRISPVPHWSWLLAVSAIFAGLWFVQKRLQRRTLGEAIWRLRAFPVDPQGVRWELFESQSFTPALMAQAIFLTAAVWFLSWSVASSTYRDNPVWIASDQLKISRFLPGQGLMGPASVPSQGQTTWQVGSFYYTLGVWPKTFKGQPVFHMIPYEYGPPKRFIGRIFARWRNPDITLQIEGPKTPDAQLSRDRIRRCLNASWSSPLLDWNCMKIRETVLSRHVSEMKTKPGQQWTLRWFTVENPKLPPEDATQGFYLEARDAENFQSRYVVVTPKGVHEAFILTGPTGPDGTEAEGTLRLAIGALQVSDELTLNIAAIDQQLQSVNLNRLFAEPPSPVLVEKLASVQGQLVSKLSVDPKYFDTWFHLAGTSLLLLKMAAQQKQEAWSVTAKPLISAICRFSTDVAPADSRMPKLQNICIEAGKY